MPAIEPTHRVVSPAGILFVCLLGASVVHGQATRTWVGGNSNWQPPGNWEPKDSPVSGDTLQFGTTGGGATTNNTTANDTYSLIFLSGAGTFTHSGNAVTVGPGGVVNNSSSNQNINLPLVLTGTSGSFAANSGNLTVGGIISGTGLTKTGTQTLTLNAANTYSGNTNVSQGTLALSASGSIASSPVITVSSGATFDVSAVTGGWTLGSGRTLAGSGTLTGPATIASGATVDAAGTLTASGNLTFNSGSIFNWSMTDETTFDRISGANFGGSGGLFNIVTDLTNGFWNQNRTFSGIFAGTGSTLASIFSTIQYNGASLTGGLVPGRGVFTISGNNLSYAAIPEPTTALAGVLLVTGLLRRRRIQQA